MWCGVHELTSQSGLDLLVHNDIHLDAALGGGFEELVQPIPFVAGRGPAQVQFGTTGELSSTTCHGNSSFLQTPQFLPQPPVQDVDVISGL